MERAFIIDLAAGVAAVGAYGAEADYPLGATAADADDSLRDRIVGWMSSLEAVGSSLPEALDAALAAIGKSPEGLVQAFKVKVPWLPCVNFQAVPKCSKNEPCTFRCCHIDRARTQLMACSWEMPSCYWKQRDLLV